MARVAAEKFGKIFLLPRDIGPSQTFILVEGLGKLARVGELRELFRPWEWGTPGLHLQGRRELMAYAGLLSLEACLVTEQQRAVRWMGGHLEGVCKCTNLSCFPEVCIFVFRAKRNLRTLSYWYQFALHDTGTNKLVCGILRTFVASPYLMAKVHKILHAISPGKCYVLSCIRPLRRLCDVQTVGRCSCSGIGAPGFGHPVNARCRRRCSGNG